jgi:hypothetical protein
VIVNVYVQVKIFLNVYLNQLLAMKMVTVGRRMYVKEAFVWSAGQMKPVGRIIFV